MIELHTLKLESTYSVAHPEKWQRNLGLIRYPLLLSSCPFLYSLSFISLSFNAAVSGLAGVRPTETQRMQDDLWRV